MSGVFGVIGAAVPNRSQPLKKGHVSARCCTDYGSRPSLTASVWGYRRRWFALTTPPSEELLCRAFSLDPSTALSSGFSAVPGGAALDIGSSTSSSRASYCITRENPREIISQFDGYGQTTDKLKSKCDAENCARYGRLKASMGTRDNASVSDFERYRRRADRAKALEEVLDAAKEVFAASSVPEGQERVWTALARLKEAIAKVDRLPPPGS